MGAARVFVAVKFAHSGWATGLAFAGAIPFLAAVAALALRLDVPVPPLAILRAYSLTIAAFMAGSVWGYALSETGCWKYLLVSNALALTAFAADRVREPHFGLGADIAVFLALLLVDLAARRGGYLSESYLRLRIAITAPVVAALGVAWAAL